jgi:hypothetical protein
MKKNKSIQEAIIIGLLSISTLYVGAGFASVLTSVLATCGKTEK